MKAYDQNFQPILKSYLPVVYGTPLSHQVNQKLVQLPDTCNNNQKLVPLPDTGTCNNVQLKENNKKLFFMKYIF
jgi:hypothetical protein